MTMIIVQDKIKPSTATKKTILKKQAMYINTPGCWVQIFDDEDFRDSTLLVEGPASFKNLKKLPNASGKDWGADIFSLITGPASWVQVFTGDDFVNDHEWYGPNTQIARLGDMGAQIDSMKIFDHPPIEYFQWLTKRQRPLITINKAEAWNNVMPPWQTPGGRLVVNLDLTGSNRKALLFKRYPQGINPKVLLLEIELSKSDEYVKNPQNISYTEELSIPRQYSEISIFYKSDMMQGINKITIIE